MRAPRGLQVEHFRGDVLGLGLPTPRLSWQLPERTLEQRAYSIALDGHDYGPVFSPDSVLMPWPGEPLGSCQRVAWQVKVITEAGESPWSGPALLETGLLYPADWVARWIEPYESERSAHVLRERFSLDESPRAARVYATAHGVYEMFLNGSRVGDRELTPGFTFYPAHLDVQVFDVGDLLVGGENLWEVVLSDGWFRGRLGAHQATDGFGSSLAFLGQLHAGDVVAATGPTWESGTGPLLQADIMAGQTEDHRRAPGGWHPVAVAEYPLDNLTYSPAPPTRRVEELRPVSVRRLDVGRQVVDLGQNINGWVRLKELGPVGTELTLVHGEALDESGDVTQDHLCVVEYGTDIITPIGQTDRVISGGADREIFEPRQTTHGFQFVRIEGHPDRLSPDDLTGVVVHTDLRRTGWFRCSDDRLNALHSAAEWSFRDNACEIPTDCPHRERSGWTGDWQIFAPSAAFLYDVAGFSAKWLRGIVAQQLGDGAVTNHAPDASVLRAESSDVGSIWRYLQGSSGWGDAIVMVPWEMWQSYGDRGLLTETWPAMKAWVDFAATAARTKRHPTRAQERPQPAPHEVYVWDGGFHWGEWVEPGNKDSDTSFAFADHGSVGTAFLHHSARLLGRIGRLIGRDDEADRYEELAANALEAWRIEFIGPDRKLTPRTQANHVRALAYGLVPDELRAETAADLVQLIREAGTHLGTGFLATPYLLPVLADSGHLDLAYELLLQDTPPSWLGMIERGATTIWENWEGIDDDGVAHGSLNHYSKGAVISFLHGYVAGIQRTKPAYRKLRIKPQPGAGLTWAGAVHDCPYGRIESSWYIDQDGAFHLTATVPPATLATVVLPDGSVLEQGPGSAAYSVAFRQ